MHHGIDYDAKPWPPKYPELVPIEGIEKLLEGVITAVRVSGGFPIGFVLDADSPLETRWNAICDRLKKAGVDTPTIPPDEGFIGSSSNYGSTVGVWLMPDNRNDGTLEHFLATLIADEDPLIDHAKTATDAAKQLGAKFPDKDRLKAEIHAWLAWQESPGLPYGTAIRARFFRHESPAATAFVGWFKRLYQIS
jgi:hypothetical protein